MPNTHSPCHVICDTYLHTYAICDTYFHTISELPLLAAMVRAGKTVVVKCTSHPSSQIFVTVVISFRPTCIHVPRSLPSINQDEQIALSSPQLNQGRRPALSLPTSFWGTQGGGEAMHTRTRAHAARCAHRVQEKIGLEARSVAFVAQAHRLQVTILD